MPPRNVTGTNTEISTIAMPTTGPDTSTMACFVASSGVSPCSMWCSTASTTTIASSTTMPIASTRPNIVSVLIENPIIAKAANVPISETGTASIGMKVARKFPRKRNTTRMTRMTASNSVWSTSSRAAVTNSVLS